MLIRPAFPTDAAGICEVHVASIRTTCATHYQPHELAAWSDRLRPASYERVLRERVMVVAEEGGRLWGFAQLHPEAEEVEAVYVHPDAGRRGVGAALLAALEAEALKRRLPRLRLNASLNAVGFYERAGYRRGEPIILKITPEVPLRCIRMEKPMPLAQTS